VNRSYHDDKMSKFLDSLVGRFEMNLHGKSYSLNQKIRAPFHILKYCIYTWRSVKVFENEEVIVLSPFNELHCEFLIPVINQLKSSNIEFKVVIYSKNLCTFFESRNIPCTFVSAIRKKNDIKTFSKRIFSILKLLAVSSTSSNSNRKSLYFSMVYLGFIEQISVAARSILSSATYCLVGYDLSVIGRQVLNECVELSVRSGRIQNGIVNYNLAGISNACDLYLWDETSKEVYVSQGFKGNVIISGNILLKRFEFENSINSEFLSLIDRVKYSRIVFVAFSGPGHYTSMTGHLKTLNILLKLIQINSNFQFVIKMHRKDSLDYYRIFENSLNVLLIDKILSKVPDAIEIIQHIDLLITGASTVAVNALFFNKGVISIDPLGELEHFAFIKKDRRITQVRTEAEVLTLDLFELSKTAAVKFEFKEDGVSQIIDNMILQSNRCAES
jgi:hypothetical protein